MSHRFGLAAVVGAVATLAVPASAAAVTGTISAPCYTHVPTKGSQPVVVSLTGGTPGADYIVAATVPGKGTGSAGSVDGTFDAAGNAVAQITDVFPPNGTINPTKGQQIQISVQDFGVEGAPETPLGTTLITTLAIDVSNKPTNPRKARRVRVSGTPFAGQRIHGFIVKGKSKHVLKRISLGKADVCGFVSRKVVVAPRPFRYGRFRLYVNAGGKLNKSKAIGFSFRIFRRYF
jgi:hypothetical protein